MAAFLPVPKEGTHTVTFLPQFRMEERNLKDYDGWSL